MYYLRIRDTVTRGYLYLAYDKAHKEFYWTQLTDFARKFKSTELGPTIKAVRDTYMMKRAIDNEIAPEFIF